MEFSLHTYLNQLRADGTPVDYIEAIKRNAQPLAERELPVILSLGHLAHATGASHRMLLSIVKRQVDPYRVFSIRKRNGAKRFICVPEQGLLKVQRWLHDYILCSSHALKSLSGAATAYMPDGGHIKNAKRHIGAEWLVKVDITRFFESVSERQVYYVFRELGYRALVAFCFARLCTRVLPYHADMRRWKNTSRWHSEKNWKFLSTDVLGHLPQGAPTSPMLANLICNGLDKELQEIAQHADLQYSRYADDMTFSGSFPNRAAATIVVSKVSKAVSRQGFSINSQKTSISKNGSRKIVTGLSVEGNTVRLPRAFKDNLRKDIHYLCKYGVEGHCNRIGQKNQFSYLMHVAGRIHYAKIIEPKLAARLDAKFKEKFPDFEKLVAQVV